MTEWHLTGSMIADFMTKLLQGKLFYRFRDIILGVKECPKEAMWEQSPVASVV